MRGAFSQGASTTWLRPGFDAVRRSGSSDLSPVYEDGTSSYVLFYKEGRLAAEATSVYGLKRRARREDGTGTSIRSIGCWSRLRHRSESSEKRESEDGEEAQVPTFSKTKEKGFILTEQGLNQP